ncbi:MAG TPA: heavy metal translocating P-type ATPase [Candidatus Saccharimonadales bacterium]|nr:heavy metal translocating P-type ATPase [Candidatus Saccharimonadales bacterium]
MKNVLKTVIKFLKGYKLLSFVLVCLIAGIVLYSLGYHVLANWILGIASSIAVIPLIIDMTQTIRGGSYGIDILAATAIIASVILRQDWAAIIIALMLTGGEALEDFAENRAKTELKALLDNKPKVAHLLKGDKTIDIKVSEIKIGNKLQILPGEVVPVDCVIISGESTFDESSLTGESVPVDKDPEDQILSGSVNISGSITVRAIRTAEDSQYEQILTLVRAASSSQSPFVRLADRYSIPFTALAYFLAISAWFISGHPIRFLEVIVVATPCPLLLAAPIALISGMSRAAKAGIIIKNGSALEKLAEIKSIAFDKTGTLTSGEAVVSSVQVFKPFTKTDVLHFASALELNSNHVLAKAVVNEAEENKLKPRPAKNVKEIAGHGLSGKVAGKDIVIGRLSLMESSGIEMSKEFKPKSIEATSTFVAVNGKLAGVISFSDKLRPETKGMISHLRKAGIKHFLMVTGDNEEAAKSVAQELGIDNFMANALPADKMHFIENASDRPVAFVGDGVNDAPVLTLSDVGIALGARGSTAASESADVVIMLDDVSKVSIAYDIAKRTFFIAKQSILVGIFISFGLMIIFAGGHFKPIVGAILQEVVDIIVIFNALRAHIDKKKPATL